MYPIMGSYGSFFFYTLTFIIWSGLVASIALTIWLARRSPSPPPASPTAMLTTLTTALLLGRLAFILTNLPFFQEQPSQLLNLWQGGFYYPALILGALLALFAHARYHHHPLTPYLILVTPALLRLYTTGWLACYFEACAFGAVTSPSPLAADLPDDFGVLALRYQTQLIAVTFLTPLFLLSLYRWYRYPPPTLTTAARFWFPLALLHLTLIPLRGDINPTGWFSFDILFAALLCGFTARLAWRPRLEKDTSLHAHRY
ncbi:MAG TPA: prolipoprotein diacylglyceryl transferase family protein [Anaerolineae bacterium]|nr:prolipoprotein diacylglyceryl transferase family protein [Anaerolineae bacterium]